MKTFAPNRRAPLRPEALLDRRDFLSLSFKALAAGSLAGLAPWPRRTARAQGRQPNIIYVVIDTTRADHMSFLGYDRNTTPNLAGLAAHSSVFTRAISPANWTLPSFASMLSGKSPANHDYNSPVDRPLLSGTLALTLANQAYRTVSVQTNQLLDKLDRDFQERRLLADQDAKLMDRLAVDQAREWLDGNAGNTPFFMFMGLLSPHQKYFPQNVISNFLRDQSFTSGSIRTVLASPLSFGPEEFYLHPSEMPAGALAILGRPRSGDFYKEARVYVAAYDSEIAYSDMQLGSFFQELKSLGLYDSSLIVVTADHGEVMDQGKMFFSHGEDMNIDQIHVPLIIKLPFQAQGQVFNQWVSLLDVAPTILDYLGLDLAGQEGVSLLSLINGAGDLWSRDEILSYSEVYRFADNGDALQAKRMAALLWGGYKFVKTVMGEASVAPEPSYVLHDLENDPWEQEDLSGSRGDLVDLFKATLETRYPNL